MVEPWYYLIGFIFGYCTLCHWIGPPKDNPKTKWPTKYRKRESRWVYLKLCLTVTTPIPMTWSFCWEKPMGQSCKFLTDLTPTKFSSSAASVYPKYSSRNKCQKGKHHLNHWTGQSSATEFGTNADGLLMAEIQSNGWPVEISTLSHDLPSTINTQRQPRKFGTFYVAVWFDSIQIRRQCRCNQENGLGM